MNRRNILLSLVLVLGASVGGYASCAQSTDDGAGSEAALIGPNGWIPESIGRDAGLGMPETLAQDTPLLASCGPDVCGRGEVCCLAMGRCVAADCVDCCQVDLVEPPMGPVPGAIDAGIAPEFPRFPGLPR